MNEKLSALLMATFIFGMAGMAEATPIVVQIRHDGTWNVETQRHLVKAFSYGIRDSLDQADMLFRPSGGFPDYPTTLAINGIVGTLSVRTVSWEESVSDPVSESLVMLLLGFVLVGLAKFGKRFVKYVK